MHQEKTVAKNVNALTFGWLHLTKIGLYVCLSNIIALVFLLLIGIISPHYHTFIEGFGDTEIYTNVTIYRAYVAMVLYFMLILAFYKSHNGIKETISPNWNEIYPYSVENNHATSLLNNISKKLGLSPPTMLVVSKPVKPPIFYYGTGEQQGTIVISESILNVLSEDELEAALTHEIYHARNVTSHFFTGNVSEKYEDLFFGILLFFLAELITLLTVGLSSTNFPNFFVAAVVSIIVLMPGLIGTFQIGLGFISLLQKDLPALMRQEFYADWFTALTTSRPLDLARALGAITPLSSMGDVELDGLSKMISLKREKAVKIKNFLIQDFYAEKVKERQAVLVIIDRLINSQVILDIKRIPESFRWLELLNEKSLQLSEFSVKFDQLGEENLRRIFEYLSNHNNFNLKECTHDLDFDSELVLYGIFALVMGGVLEIHLPPEDLNIT